MRMMKCMVVQDEGIICVFLLFITIINSSFVGESSQTIQALCSSNKYIYNLEPEVNHQLRLTSDNSTGHINKWYQKSKRRCIKEFKTNDGASHFSVVISNMSIPSCSDKCHCNYLGIAEPELEEKYCGVSKEPSYFESKNGYLIINFHHTLSMQFEVTLNFQVKRNTYIVTGTPKEGYQSGQFIETPYFPKSYQQDYIAEYVLQSDYSDGHVMLMFIDYEIARESFIEIFGHNGTHPARFNGDVFRPPVFISQNRQLNLRFEANHQVKFGFRAVCFFIKDRDLKVRKPFTNCGGLKEELGGILTIDVHANHDYYDCLWHLSPPISFIQTSFFLSVSNISLENIGPNATLEFREGLNSKSKLVKSINCYNGSCNLIPTEITVPAATGLYLRFNGLLYPDSVFKMIYGTYRSGNCSEYEVSCNERCLLPELRCDGIEQCPDGQDEQECFFTPTVLSTTSFSTGTKLRFRSKNTMASFLVMLSIGLCGLVIFILIVIFTVYRHLKKFRSPSNEVEQPQVAGELLGPSPNVCARISNCFDHPPSYEDFIQAADCYPPLLYTRAAKRNSEPYCRLYTTSFCGKDTLIQNSIHSFSNHCSDTTSSSAESSLFPEPGCSFSQSNVEWTFENSHPRNQISSSLKRATSFDSNLNNVSEASNCLVHVSITHSMRPQPVVSKHHSLPTRFKVKDLKPNEIDITFQAIVPGMPCNKERRFSSCIACHDSLLVRSEVMTTIKARCFSDPCKTQQ